MCIRNGLGRLICIHILTKKINQKVTTFGSRDMTRLAICRWLILYILTHFFQFSTKENPYHIHSASILYERVMKSFKFR